MLRAARIQCKLPCRTTYQNQSAAVCLELFDKLFDVDGISSVVCHGASVVLHPVLILSLVQTDPDFIVSTYILPGSS